TSTDVQAVVPGDYTFLAADSGSKTFSATLKTAGTQSISVSDGTIGGTSSPIQVSAAAASSLVVSGCQSPTTAGESHSFTVTAKDGFGNTATGYRGTVHFSSSDVQAVVPPDYPFIAADQGTHIFSATLATVGPQSISASDGTISGSQSGIVV